MKIKRDTLIGFVAGTLGFLLVLAVFWLLTRQAASGGGIEGVITARQFEQAPETQITVGSGGVHRRETSGVYRFHVRATDNGRVYTVTVDPKTYNAYKEGDRYYFARPAP